VTDALIKIARNISFKLCKSGVGEFEKRRLIIREGTVRYVAIADVLRH